jgi:biotin-(acetyl-CoA carboxylase) ligase
MPCVHWQSTFCAFSSGGHRTRLRSTRSLRKAAPPRFSGGCRLVADGRLLAATRILAVRFPRRRTFARATRQRAASRSTCSVLRIDQLDAAREAISMRRACSPRSRPPGAAARRWQTESACSPCRCAAPSRGRCATSALSLVSGVLPQALHAGRNRWLKWPNDLVVVEAGGAKAKLGGIGRDAPAGNRVTIVIGIGINVRESRQFDPARRVASLGRSSIACLAQHCRGAPTSSAALMRSSAGFSPAAEWEAMDAHAGQRIRLRLANGRSISGIGAGRAADGALRLVTRSGEKSVHSGRIVSARLA